MKPGAAGRTLRVQGLVMSRDQGYLKSALRPMLISQVAVNAMDFENTSLPAKLCHC